MLHTWQIESSTGQDQTGSQSNDQHPRRASRVTACETCRRRKIRCNGQQPCEACLWYSRPEACHYTILPKAKSTSSRRPQDEATAARLREYEDLFARLFPDRNLNQLRNLPRAELLDLLEPSASKQFSPYASNTSENNAAYTVSPDAARLEQLQPVPDGITSTTDTSPSDVRGLTDEVNALSLSVQTSTSFLGISSVAAALRVIFWLNADAQQLCTQALTESQGDDHNRDQGNQSASAMEHPPLYDNTITESRPSSSLWEEVPLLRAYFAYIHPFAPVLDETNFRTTYMEGKRSDSRWLLLLNTVLALGSVADASVVVPHDHQHYWQKASQHLNIQSLNSTHIETIQALSLIGGLYLHYINEPRLANSIMGAASRLAASLGLHRELAIQETARNAQYNQWIDVRRRTWWTLFILDAWAGYGLSRPGMRRLNEAVSVQAPTHLHGDPAGQLLTLFKNSVQFCSISTELEDSLACSPFLTCEQREMLDQKLDTWFRSTTAQNTAPATSSSVSHGILILRNVMRWRYLNCRIIVHRPILLHVAVSGLDATSIAVSEKQSVDVCSAVAIELINDITTTWQAQRPCQMAGWNATWLLYQALMVPLILLFSRFADPVMQDMCRRAVETGIVTLETLSQWSNTAQRSREVVKQIYSVSLVQTSPHPPNIADYLSQPPGNLDGSSQNSFPYDYSALHHVLRPTFPDQSSNDMFEALDWCPGWDETGAAGLWG